MAGMLWLAAALAWSPLATAGPPQTPARSATVFVVDGVGGFDPLGATARLILPWSGVRHEVREFAWAPGKGRMVRDIQDTRHLLAKAEELSRQVLALKTRETDRPIFLIGHSAGTFVVLEATRLLPPATLERIVLLSAAVSPAYDLSPALRATRGEIVSYNSTLDRFWLCWATSQFGTADRVYGPAAGLDGFEVPAHLNPEDKKLYQRLVQVPWQPPMMLEGRGGLHVSTHGPIFVARELARWLQLPVKKNEKQ